MSNEVPTPYTKPESETSHNMSEDSPSEADLLQINFYEVSASYIPFDPEKELLSIRHLTPEEEHLSPDEKRDLFKRRLDTYKRDLLHQKEGVAHVIRTMYEMMHEYDGLPWEALLRTVYKHASNYRFSRKQLRHFYEASRKFDTRHRAVQEYRHKYESDSALFEACFGALPKGDIEVMQGPITLHFRCFDPVDYQFITTLPARQNTEIVSSETHDRTYSMNSAGISLRSVLIKELAGAVTAENVQQLPNEADDSAVDDASKMIRDHEEQHQFNALFQESVSPIMFETAIEKAIKTTNTREEAIRVSILNCLRMLREGMGFEEKAKDEILAHYGSGNKTSDILRILTTEKMYDYATVLGVWIEIVLPGIRDEINRAKSLVNYPIEDHHESTMSDHSKHPTITTDDVASQVDKVFREEYFADIGKWIGAVSTLEEKGYSRTEIMSFLYQEPAHSWPNLARRLPAKPKVQTYDT